MAYVLTKRYHGKQRGKVRAYQHPKVVLSLHTHTMEDNDLHSDTHTQKREKKPKSINTTIFQDDGTQLENILYTLK